MALTKEIKTKSAKIAIWQITEEIDELKELLKENSIVEHIETQYNNPKRQREQLISHILIKHLLGEAKAIKHHANGMPYINGCTDLFVSISHSKKSIAVAISAAPIGIDLEEIDRKQYSLLKKYASQTEQNWVENNQDATEKQLISAIIWSAKEAIYKLANTEGLLFESEIEITPFNPNTENSFLATYRNEPCKCDLLVISDQLLVVSC